MKKFKKVIKKLPTKCLSLILVFALTISYFLPLAKVFAEDEYVVKFTAADNHEMTIDGGHLKIDGQYVELRDVTDDSKAIGEVKCASGTCTITVSDGKAGKLNYNGDKKFTLYMQGHAFDMNHTFRANEEIRVQDYEEEQEHHDSPEEFEPHFDGLAYVVWSCKNGGVCYHYFDDIPAFDDGNSTFYKNTEVTDDNTNEAFDVNAEYKGWYLKDSFEAWVEYYKNNKKIVGNIDWSKVDPEDILGAPVDMREWEDRAVAAGKCQRPEEGEHRNDFESCVDEYAASQDFIHSTALQPVGEPTDNNAYVSYGDRNFKVVIYNEQYKGVTIGDLSDLNYYPSNWSNPFTRTDQYDISGTTKNNPTVIDAILLESTINIKALNYNSFEIASIEALDVPADAVQISKVNGEFKIVFSSNFYDNVVFKVTDKLGKVSYMQIRRYTIDGYIRFFENKPTITAELYFDRNKTYTNFDLTAKIIYKDGTVRTVSLDAYKGIDDGLGNITEAYEVDEENTEFGPSGKGLKKSMFQYVLKQGEERTISQIFINGEYVGSTDSNYAGAYVGSGEGVSIYMEEEE